MCAKLDQELVTHLHPQTELRKRISDDICNALFVGSLQVLENAPPEIQLLVLRVAYRKGQETNYLPVRTASELDVLKPSKSLTHRSHCATRMPIRGTPDFKQHHLVVALQQATW